MATQPRRLDYAICDVFTDTPLTGNALAVFTDAAGLDDATLQALAREVNLSETAFVSPASTADADARIRIFTPTMELPFAGHPTLGSAFVLSRAKPGKLAIRLETGRGTVHVLWSSGHHFGWMTQPLPLQTPFGHTDEAMAALGLGASTLPVELYDNGPKYVLVEARTAAEVAELKPDLLRLAGFGTFAFVVFARSGARWKVRVFAPGEGIPEDPGTGAAAGALAVHLCRHGRAQFGEELIIEQGVEIARPSVLHARALLCAGVIDRVEVGGSVVQVASGQFLIPAR